MSATATAHGGRGALALAGLNEWRPPVLREPPPRPSLLTASHPAVGCHGTRPRTRRRSREDPDSGRVPRRRRCRRSGEDPRRQLRRGPGSAGTRLYHRLHHRRHRAALITKAGARSEVVGHSLDRLESVKAALDKAALSKAPKKRARLVRRRRGQPGRRRKPLGRRGLCEGCWGRRPAGHRRPLHRAPRPRWIRGGDAYYMNRLLLFRGLRRRAAPRWAFVTAGHCGGSAPPPTVSTSRPRAPSRARPSRAVTTPGSPPAPTRWRLVNGYGRGRTPRSPAPPRPSSAPRSAVRLHHRLACGRI
ncbi:Serine protease OS=Streptomyces microflavus OX=1919 GN=Smic_34700 PE=3 SV=1 [Streptomyces microflavus]